MGRRVRSTVVALCAALLIGATPQPIPTYFFGKPAEAMWSWLPYYGDPIDAWRDHTATMQTIKHFDNFVYHGRVVDMAWGGEEPSDGEFTEVSWPGGGGKGRILYDYVHRVVFYKVACCSEGEQVLAESQKKPVVRLPGTDLSRVHTVHGFALGDPSAKVLRVNGAAVLQSIPRHPGVKLLAYAAMYDGTAAPKWCGQWQNFIFRNDRLISNGC